MAWKVSHSETKPLSGGSAEIAAQPIRNTKRGLRHAVDQAAELFHVALAGRAQHRAGAEEQQALEQRVVEHVQQRRRSAPAPRAGIHAVGLERQRQAEPMQRSMPDILDRRIGQQRA